MQRKIEAKKVAKIDVYSILRVAVAILIAYIVAIIIIYACSKDPQLALRKFFLGPFQSKRFFFNIIEAMIPLVIVGLAMNLMLKAGLMNLAADGALYLGAVIAAAFAISFALPKGLHQAIIFIVAALVGGIITLIPAIIKYYSGADEFVVSMMLNTAIFWIGQFIINRYYLDLTRGYASRIFNSSARLGVMIKGTQTHYGLILMVVIIFIVYYLTDKSQFGYELKVTGINTRFARYSGIKVTTIILISQFAGGAIAAIGGATEMLGIYQRFLWNLPVTIVWDALLIVLISNSRTLFIPLSAFFISYLRVGADMMSRTADIDTQIVAIIQAVIILLISAERFMYFLKKRKEEKEALALKEKETYLMDVQHISTEDVKEVRLL